jgi:hypothetical protein
MTIAMQASTAPVRNLVLSSISDVLEHFYTQMNGPAACSLVTKMLIINTLFWRSQLLKDLYHSTLLFLESCLEVRTSTSGHIV